MEPKNLRPQEPRPSQGETAHSRLHQLKERFWREPYEDLFAFCQKRDPERVAQILAYAERLLPPENGGHGENVQDAKYTLIVDLLIDLAADLAMAEAQELHAIERVFYQSVADDPAVVPAAELLPDDPEPTG